MISCTISHRYEKLKKAVVDEINDLIGWSRKCGFMNTRATVNAMYMPTEYEHMANTCSHAIMIIPSILGSELLLWKSQRICSIVHITMCSDSETGLSVGNPDQMQFSTSSFHNNTLPSYSMYEFCSKAYGISLVLLFVVSSLFHWVSWTQSQWNKRVHIGCCVRRPSLNKFFHICDRATIYCYIAGFYCPWLMLQDIHYSFMWLQWGIWNAAILGTLYTFLFLERNKLLETLLYVIVATVPGVAVVICTQFHSTTTGLTELILGGIFYFMGVLFFKSDGLIPFAHAIWHMFVAAGALSQYAGVYRRFYSY